MGEGNEHVGAIPAERRRRNLKAYSTEMMVLSLFRLGTFTGGPFVRAAAAQAAAVPLACSPWLPFDAEINGCLERDARENAVSLAGRT
jgi:hypothetical protein